MRHEGDAEAWLRVRAEGGEVPVEWADVPRSERPYLQAHGGPLSHGQLAAATRSQEPEAVEIEGLVATQPTVGLADALAYADDPDRKRKGATNPKTGALIDLPIVVELEGERYIHDGHHRLMAALARGERYADARVVDADSAALEAWARGRSGEDEAED